METFSPGLIIKNRYELLRLLGKGGQCHVYLALDRETGREVVIKELIRTSKDKTILSQNIEMFKKEYEFFQRLKHRALPEGYDYFEEKEKHFLVVEYVPGKNLKTVLAFLDRAFSEEEVIEFGIQLAEVLVYLAGIKPHPVVIRDVKPANIMLSSDGTLRLIDFTIAREFDRVKEKDTVKIGSIGYAPPEQYKGLSDCRSDIYALGATLYELLTKHDPSGAPFQFEPVRYLDPGISKEMNDILEKALELNPELRYQKPEEILNDLSLLQKAKKSFNYEELLKKVDGKKEIKPSEKEPVKKFSSNWIVLGLVIFFTIAVIIFILLNGMAN